MWGNEKQVKAKQEKSEDEAKTMQMQRNAKYIE